MTDVVIAGIGQIPVGEHWDLSLRDMAVKAIQAAIKDGGGLKPQALYIGNMLASVISHQSNLGALLVDYAGLDGIESYTAEAAGASGAAALRMGTLAVLSGYIDCALVLGVEKWTDAVGSELESALSMGLDYDYESVPGLGANGQAGLIMQRYLYEHHLDPHALAGFPMLAHANAVNNPYAMYRKAITREMYDRADLITDPLNLYDSAPFADGAAAVLICRRELLPEKPAHPLVRISASAVAIDTLAVHDRRDPLGFEAVRHSIEQACRKAGMQPEDADIFEFCDSYSVYAALSLEAAGFAQRGEGWELALNGSLALTGKLPSLTMGGQKGRGNPLGASGVYQIAEATQQLRGEAGANQVKNARRALVQSLGGAASTAITHVLERIGE
ncbi:MAG: thiolase domain-containing protein [Anaerolineaceae bacterium]